MKEFIEKLIGRLASEVNYNDGAETGVAQMMKVVNELAKEYEECIKSSCSNCEVYDNEKHYCPKWCDVIKGTVAEIEENNNGFKMVVNEDIKNPFANISTVGCVNCDHKDEYVIELESDNNGWIPVSERLPGEEYIIRLEGAEFYKHVLTTTQGEDAQCCVGWYDREDDTWYDLEGFAYHPIAWMPLPAPYQQKGE